MRRAFVTKKEIGFMVEEPWCWCTLLAFDNALASHRVVHRLILFFVNHRSGENGNVGDECVYWSTVLFPERCEERFELVQVV